MSEGQPQDYLSSLEHLRNFQTAHVRLFPLTWKSCTGPCLVLASHGGLTVSLGL